MKQMTQAKRYRLSVVIPFIDNWDILYNCLYKLAYYTTKRTQLILIDNGSDENYREKIKETIKGSNLRLKYVKNNANVGVLHTFKQGLELAKGDIIVYLHSDVLIHEPGWNERIERAFNADPQLGLAGLFGARGLHPDGGREGSMSHMVGQEWGKCECHSPAALHHGELMMETKPCVVFDGVGLFFRKSVLEELNDTSDLFDPSRAPHHFYDRIMSLKVLSLGYHMCVIGIKFDHYSGATANHSDKYTALARKWCKKNNHPMNSVGWDDTIYWIAEKQWRNEPSHRRLPVRIDENYNVRWQS